MSSIPILEMSKLRNRKPKEYGFGSFCEGPPDSGAFTDNIRIFLQECAEPEDYSFQGIQIWCTNLVVQSKNIALPLYTMEENVSSSPKPFCDHCTCTGWGNNFVSKRRYHVIIPIDEEWNKVLEEGVLDVRTHILHGLIHCNGFGHLLRINGIEGGSKSISGREIMYLRDRFCTKLRAWKISVEDISKKRSVDLRLLYGVAYEHPWFGEWEYKLYSGSYGVEKHNYRDAIQTISTLKLDDVVP